MSTKTTFNVRALAIVIALTLSVLLSSAALADNTVTLSIVARGTLTAGVIDGTLFSVDYSDDAQTDFGKLHLIVSDPRGTSAGWNVSLSSTDFVYHGKSIVGRDIDNAGFRICAATAPRVIAGQPIVAAGPNFDPLVGASLDTPRTVIWSNPGSGSGDYEQYINVMLPIPAYNQIGRYEAILTVAITSGP
jgi:hypothetical protein